MLPQMSIEVGEGTDDLFGMKACEKRLSIPLLALQIEEEGHKARNADSLQDPQKGKK